MINKITPKNWKIMSALAVFSAIVFIVLQLLPGLNATATTDNGNTKPIAREEAIQLATNFAQQQAGLSVEKAEAYHQANKLYTGYISKYKLLEQHKEKFESLVPFDQYQVNLSFGNEGNGYVIMSLFTGDITGWNFSLNGLEATGETTIATLKEELNTRHFPLNDMTHFDQYESVNGNSLATLTNTNASSGGWYISNDTEVIGEAIVQIDTLVIESSNGPVVSRYLPDFIIPNEYTTITEKQDLYANIWTYGGYMGFTFIFGILAIIYAILYRRHTSFKFGAWLTAISTIISFIVNFGMIKSQLALESNLIQGELIVNMLMYAFVVISILFGAVGVYFSFVAGDGLWKAQGFQLWPRFKEAHYGRYIWDTMKVSYLLAIILLGIQNVIYLLLTTILGTWSANDTSQSFLNFEYSWLYPAIAWFAAITEEVTYRYFGVGIFRRWFKNTFWAALIPSLVWAAGHTLYPLYPASTRILELVIIGLLFTWIMIKFGFIAGIFTHAIFNTILMSMELFMYGKTIDIISAIIFLVLPIIIAFILKWLHGRKKDTAGPIIRPEYPPATPQG